MLDMLDGVFELFSNHVLKRFIPSPNQEHHHHLSLVQ